MKIEVGHLIPGIDGLMTRLKERRPSRWDIPPSPEQYERRLAVEFETAAFVDPTVVAALFFKHTRLLQHRVWGL